MGYAIQNLDLDLDLDSTRIFKIKNHISGLVGLVWVWVWVS